MNKNVVCLRAKRYKTHKIMFRQQYFAEEKKNHRQGIFRSSRKSNEKWIENDEWKVSSCLLNKCVLETTLGRGGKRMAALANFPDFYRRIRMC